MSVAGIRSNRGDFYQKLVAFDWALEVLSNQDFQWIGIDSVLYSVDDVVVGKTDGTCIACQCKKNQAGFKAWTITDLADEIDKVATLLANDPKIIVRFYSRSNFGDLAKLREYSLTQVDESSYQQSLGKEQRSIDRDLSVRLVGISPSLSTFEFLNRTNFVTSEDFDRMEEDLRNRLGKIVSNPGIAFDALWISLDKLGARISSSNSSSAIQHQLTKNELKIIIQKAGSIIAPPMVLTDIHHSFSSTSSIGRSWRRDIAGVRIVNPVLDELLAAIDTQKRSILLTGLPGSGKTCVMLELQEALEKRAKDSSDIVSLFIQSREFADLATSEERQAQGLSLQWVEEAARLAENFHVIVVIDSLDVLSIAREHRVLQYFLAQIDRILRVPNITVVTACRAFDRHYDRRIAERHWDCELKCELLDWDAEVAPLLTSLKIAIADIDALTRDLICNPRELALFAELALRDGSFNVVTSQALAQRYLEAIVLYDKELGDTAIQAVEAIASEMLLSRSLVVPRQRFPASQDILRKLCSLNILQETQEGKLTFGHQTLLDVLVISRAMRNGVTLNEFINDLPPVPFVRPSIRSFIAQLALGERREFRKQLRTVLKGNAAFHIKRLAAESFSAQKPQDDDWSLIRDLRENHRDVFQVVYYAADSIEWHHFWLKHFVPYLKMSRDAEGIAMHVHRMTQWGNIDTNGVLSFWTETLSLVWFDGKKIADQLAMYLSEIKPENIDFVVPLLGILLTLPRSEYSFLGRVIANCVVERAVDDNLLWRYMTDGIKEEDLLTHRLNNKLKCHDHEFGNRNDNFISTRMLQSCVLLDNALDSIEHWSLERASCFGEVRKGFRHGFLGETSFEDTHSQRDMKHVDSLNILLDSVEASIFNHANKNTAWWQKNCKRICFNQEGALLYFGILACTGSPEENIELICRILCNRELLESELSYELGELMHSAFKLIPTTSQDEVMMNILTIKNDYISDACRLKAQAELIISIPCHLRSAKLQKIVEQYEKKVGIFIRQPHIYSRGGTVSAPFSFDIFISASDRATLKLLTHYMGHSDWGDRDFLVGGEREVGWQLHEASSRQPLRFLNFLSNYWTDIPPTFCDDIMGGVSAYLAYRYGNLTPNGTWEPLEDPDAQLMAKQILDELERHSMYWRFNHISAKALEACANVIQDQQAAERLIFMAIGFAGLYEKESLDSISDDLINTGVNMVKGDVTEALMILANNFLERGDRLPGLLAPTLKRFASDEHPAIRAMILQRLPFLQSKSFDLGWDLFNIAMKENRGLWKIAERCLYYAYKNHFKIVGPLLVRLRREGVDKDLETWGRISALSTMTGHIDFNQFISDLNTLKSTEAWHGAATVWANTENLRQHREQCLAGLYAGLHADSMYAIKVAKYFEHIFSDGNDVIIVPIDIIFRCFSVFEKDSSNQNEHYRFFKYHGWLNAISQQNPEQALAAAEIYLTYVRHSKQYMYDHNDSLTQLMTRLFSEAEEREESDQGAMLQRVVALQDILLSMGVKGIVDWLKAAERP
ncbi:ATPase family protein associated with various cellular activities (AAA) [Enterobacter sp. BIGb0383]|uniref:AAA family ATPase n=1 Tax=unclassified Enterobacter TaxID=2608935 RepID=UPI000F48645B|nr:MULTISPECIES: ATP-binding protein [unclassified Enterobacter]ROP62015.1 ATPase family protein associated with various cellular activities (AAA) [Enterobacter sp. BIGb0383]ROS12176.1 ATPase family protein associated with various cellular activities (AAA) [Enterobacter sp. BIGb0359]